MFGRNVHARHQLQRGVGVVVLVAPQHFGAEHVQGTRRPVHSACRDHDLVLDGLVRGRRHLRWSGLVGRRPARRGRRRLGRLGVRARRRPSLGLRELAFQRVGLGSGLVVVYRVVVYRVVVCRLGDGRLRPGPLGLRRGRRRGRLLLGGPDRWRGSLRLPCFSGPDRSEAKRKREPRQVTERVRASRSVSRHGSRERDRLARRLGEPHLGAVTRTRLPSSAPRAK
jgi:hypothetical protein